MLDLNSRPSTALRYAGLAALTFVFIAGCGDDAATEGVPTTHPVKGKVLTTDGTPVKRGLIEFHDAAPNEGPEGTGQLQPAIGIIDENGNYSLYILTTEGKKVDGAMPGQYRVSVTPDAGSDQTTFDAFDPIYAEKTYTVEPKENNIDVQITLPK